MFKTNTDQADCEIRAVIRFLNARNMKPAETHRQVKDVYIENVMSDGMARKWYRILGTMMPSMVGLLLSTMIC